MERYEQHIRLPLHGIQVQSILRLRQSLSSGAKRPVLQLPTGAGKTVLAAEIIASARAKRKRVLFTVPAIELIDQTVHAFAEQGILDVGVIQASHPLTDPDQPVQVASIQTLMRRPIPPVDLAIIDECHRMFKLYDDWLLSEMWERTPFIGLSATPWSKGLGRYFDDLIIGATTKDLIDAGILCPFEVWAPSSPDLTGVKVTAGDYQVDQLSEAMSDKTLVADVVETWCKQAEGLPTLCFAVDRQHARHLQEQFLSVAVPTAYVDAYTPRDERDEIRKAFHSGDVKVVCNVGVLTTGVDWDVRCLILARPTKSKILFTQIIGRALRTAPGKDVALILDHSDTHLRLGMVTDIMVSELDDGKPKKGGEASADSGQPLPALCNNCDFLKPPRTPECPKCGHVDVASSNFETEDGELTRLGASDNAPPPRPPEQEDKSQWFAELMGYAKENNYKPGWAAHKFKEKFKHWPPRAWNDMEPAFAGSKVRSYIRSRNIAYHKARQKREHRAEA